MRAFKKLSAIIFLIGNKGILLSSGYNLIPYLQITSPKSIRLEAIVQPFNRMNLQPIPKGEKRENAFVPTPTPKTFERQFTVTKSTKQPKNSTTSQEVGSTASPQRLSAEEIVLYIQDDNKDPKPLPFKELNVNLANLPQPAPNNSSSVHDSASTDTTQPTQTDASQ